MIIPLLTFAGIALKPGKKMAQFSQFQFRVFPCHPREQFQCLNIVLTTLRAEATFSRYQLACSYRENVASAHRVSPNKNNWTIIFGIHSMRESNF